MTYTRHSPSPRYRYLAEQYRTMHAEGDTNAGIPTEEMFPGYSLMNWVVRIRELIAQTGAQNLLDYGSGKGQQYDMLDAQRRQTLGGAESVLDYWGVDEVRCYDPNYAPYSKLPEGRFDGVICTDVLEHCPEEDIGWILGEIFGYASRFVFAVVASYPAAKLLPDGSNAHCTIQSAEWWQAQLDAAGQAHPVERYEVALLTREGGKMKVRTLTGSPA
jgi:hypothetical protein